MMLNNVQCECDHHMDIVGLFTDVQAAFYCCKWLDGAGFNNSIYDCVGQSILINHIL